MSGRRQLFAYWQVPAPQAAAALREMASWQQRLRVADPGLLTELHLRRDRSELVLATVMEVYGLAVDQAPEGLDDAWLRRIGDEGDRASAGWRSGARHLEVFERWR